MCLRPFELHPFINAIRYQSICGCILIWNTNQTMKVNQHTHEQTNRRTKVILQAPKNEKKGDKYKMNIGKGKTKMFAWKQILIVKIFYKQFQCSLNQKLMKATKQKNDFRLGECLRVSMSMHHPLTSLPLQYPETSTWLPVWRTQESPISSAAVAFHRCVANTETGV